jgi:proline racemase
LVRKLRAQPTARSRWVPEINHIYGTTIVGARRHRESTQANCCIFADREVDRSPTGSGTAGRVAQLYLRGKIARGEVFVNESVIGTSFSARIVDEMQVGQFPAAIAEVAGTAHICGFSNWIIDDRDPLKYGFLVRERRSQSNARLEGRRIGSTHETHRLQGPTTCATRFASNIRTHDAAHFNP